MEEDQPFLEKLLSLKQIIAEPPAATSYKRDNLTLNLLRSQPSRNYEDYTGFSSSKFGVKSLGKTSVKGAIELKLERQTIEDDYMVRMVRRAPRHFDQQRDNSFSNLRTSLPQVSTKNSLSRSIDVGASPDRNGSNPLTCQRQSKRSSMISPTSALSCQHQDDRQSLPRFKERLDALASIKIQTQAEKAKARNDRLSLHRQSATLREQVRGQLLRLYRERAEAREKKFLADQESKMWFQRYKQKLREKMQVEKALLSQEISLHKNQSRARIGECIQLINEDISY